MATAHLSVKVGKSGKASPHAEYITRDGKYAQRLEQGEKLEAAESGNMPYWAQHDPAAFWKAADLHERANGTVYREHEIALPRELTPEQRTELVRDWVRRELGERHAYTWAIHNKTALDGGEQPHVHLMYSERTNDGIERDPQQYFKRYNPKHPERGGAKKHRSGETPNERKAALVALRDRWETLHNAHIARAQTQDGIGILQQHRLKRAQISMKSLAEQGIERTPEPHMTPSESAALQRKAAADRAAYAAVIEIATERSDREAAERETNRQAQAAQRIQQEAQRRAEAARAAEQQRQTAEAQAKARETENRKQKAREALAALPTEQLVETYRHAESMSMLSGREQVKQGLESGAWYAEQRRAQQQTEQQIQQLRQENRNIAAHYRNEQSKRENRFFGLGRIGTRLIEENARQQQMQQAYQARSVQIEQLKEQQERQRDEYSARLEAEADKLQQAYRTVTDGLEAEILRRPKDEFTEPYRQAKQDSSTRAAKTAADHAEQSAERARRANDPVAERLSYYTGAKVIANAEKVAQQQQERERQWQTQSRGKGITR